MDNFKSPEISELTELVSKYSPIFIELRKRILFTVAVFAIAALVGFVFYETIIRFLINILSLQGINIVFTSPFQFINLAINCGLATGIVFAFPLITYQILSFLKPALKDKEFKMIVRSLPISIALFLTGFSFGFLIMKWQIEIFLTRSVSLGIGNILDISRLLSTVLLTSILMGIGFQFPILMLLLLRIGVIKHHQLSRQRPWIYLGSFLFAILLPPDSILADVLLALPIVLMFELVLIFNRLTQKKQIANPLVN